MPRNCGWGWVRLEFGQESRGYQIREAFIPDSEQLRTSAIGPFQDTVDTPLQFPVNSIGTAKVDERTDTSKINTILMNQFVCTSLYRAHSYEMPMIAELSVLHSI